MIGRAACVLVAVCLASPAAAQTAEQVFDPAQLHEMRLFINSRDLDELRATYLENAFYPADLQWGATTIRNAAVRSRGGGRAEAISTSITGCPRTT